MRDTSRPVLLDVSRLVARNWTGKRSTGIDRVAYAYLRHFAPRSLAVIQFRGMVRVLDFQRSDQLFAMLLGPSAGFRAKFAKLLPRVLFARTPVVDLAGLVYLNVGNGDFDLPAHRNWAEREGVRTAYFIHDLIPTLQPQFSRPYASARNRARVRSALRHGDQIIVSSKVVARDLRAYSAAEGLATPELVVSPIAGETFDPKPASLDQPYFLCVGTIEPRKNHALLFKAWRDLAQRLGKDTPRLVIVGQKGPMTGRILDPLRAPELGPHIELREKCRDDELASLLNNATALLFPSLAEGFGLPLAEALQIGTPVIASDIPTFREIGQGIPTFLAGHDHAAWADAVIAHSANRATQADKSARSAQFTAPTWAAHFDVVERAIAPSRLKTRLHYETSLAS